MTKAQPSPALPVQAQVPTAGSSIAELTAFALVLAGFFAMLISLTKR